MTVEEVVGEREAQGIDKDIDSKRNLNILELRSLEAKANLRRLYCRVSVQVCSREMITGIGEGTCN
jgi:hypothetical protein